VYNPAVIPQPLTPGNKRSYPDPEFSCRCGKAGKTLIKSG
jgi:hypothetical protein